jgi:hypothetical protein
MLLSHHDIFAEDFFPDRPFLSEQANPWITDEMKLVVNTSV